MSEMAAAAKPTENIRRVLNFDQWLLFVFVIVLAPYLKKFRCAFDPWIAE